jgi:hypothetical protein
VVERREGDAGEVVPIKVPATSAAAGVVEIEALPRHGRSVRLSFESEAGAIDIYDLFVISYG